MGDPDFAAIRGPLAKLQDEGLSRRDRDVNRRLALRWLETRDLALRETEDGLAVGVVSVEGDYERFEPQWEVRPDGSVASVEAERGGGEDAETEQPLSEEERQGMRGEVQRIVDGARGRPDEASRLLPAFGLLEETRLQSAPWTDRDHVLEPVLRRVGEWPLRESESFVASFSGRSFAVLHLLRLMVEGLEREPGWIPGEELIALLLEARFLNDDDPEGAWEDSMKLLGRAGKRTEDDLFRIATGLGAPYDDALWVEGVLERWPPKDSRPAAKRMLASLGRRGAFQTAEAIAGVFHEAGEPEDLDWLLDLVRSGVAQEVGMTETWGAITRIRQRHDAHRWEQLLQDAGVDGYRLRLCSGFAGSLSQARLNLRTREFWVPPWPEPEGERLDAARTTPPGEPSEWWTIPCVEARELRSAIGGFCASLPEPIRSKAKAGLGSMFFLRAVHDALLGHPDEWVRFNELLEALEESRFQEAAQVALTRLADPRALPGPSTTA